MITTKSINILFILFLCCIFTLNVNAFPKKKHSIIKDKIDREKFEHVSDSGYLYGFMEYCNYSNASDKEFYKRIKGLVAYTNWTLFLEFNKGVQMIQNELQVAGIGYAGSASGFQEKKIDWKQNLTGCDKKSINKVYDNMDNIVENDIINFMLARDNYESNLKDLLSALKADKKDDYSSIIQRIISITDPNYDKKTTEISQESVVDNSSERKNTTTKLKELKSFFEEDLISEDEYNEQKKEILDNM